MPLFSSWKAPPQPQPQPQPPPPAAPPKRRTSRAATASSSATSLSSASASTVSEPKAKRGRGPGRGPGHPVKSPQPQIHQHHRPPQPPPPSERKRQDDHEPPAPSSNPPLVEDTIASSRTHREDIELHISRTDHVKEALYKVWKVSLGPSLYCGYFPFHFYREDAAFHFRAGSWNTIAVIFRLFFAAAFLFHYTFNLTTSHDFFWDISETEHIADMISAYSCFIGEVVMTAALFWNRRKIQMFQKALVKLIIECVAEIDLKKFPVVASEARRYRYFTILTCFATLAFNLPREIYVLAKYPKPTSEVYMFPVFATLAVFPFFLRLFLRIWIISMIECLTIAATSLKERLKMPPDHNDTVENNFSSNYDHIVNMEAVISQFNDSLGLFISIALLTKFVNILMVLFVTILYFRYLPVDVGIAYSIPGVAATVMLWAICWSATNLENEMKDVHTAFQDSIYSYVLVNKDKGNTIDPVALLMYLKSLREPPKLKPGDYFTLNRQTLSHIMGMIAMYLIILVQFHVNDATSNKNGTRSM